MAIAQNPLTGKMSGSVANFVTSVSRGKNVVKSKAFMPKDANSEAQQFHRSIFKLLCDEYKSVKELVTDGFPQRPLDQTPYNSFISENFSEAIDTAGGTPKIDYTKMKVSLGSLEGVRVTAAEIVAEGVKISYDTKIRYNDALAEDMVMALVKRTDGERYVVKKERGTAETDSILLPAVGTNKEDIVYIYLIVVAPARQKASETVYVKIA